MKKTFYLLLIILAVLQNKDAFSRSFAISPQVGYFFKESFPIVNGNVHINEGFYYGGVLSYGATDAIDVELQYSHRTSILTIDASTTTPTLNLNTNWFLLNGCYNFDNGAPAIPFLAVGMGWVNFNPEEDGRATENRFAMDVGLGMKVAFSDRVGLRLSTNFLATMNSSSSFENEYGDDAYLMNKMAYVTQFGFRAGVYVKLVE